MDDGRNETRLTYLEEAIVKIAEKIDKLEEHLLGRKPVNWIGIITTGIAVFTLLGSISFALLTYVDVRMTQQRVVVESWDRGLREDVDEVQMETREEFSLLQDFRTQTHYEMGRIFEFQKIVEQQLAEIKERISRSELRHMNKE